MLSTGPQDARLNVSRSSPVSVSRKELVETIDK